MQKSEKYTKSTPKIIPTAKAPPIMDSFKTVEGLMVKEKKSQNPRVKRAPKRNPMKNRAKTKPLVPATQSPIPMIIRRG